MEKFSFACWTKTIKLLARAPSFLQQNDTGEARMAQ
jgi:hypothetical protein